MKFSDIFWNIPVWTRRSCFCKMPHHPDVLAPNLRPVVPFFETEKNADTFAHLQLREKRNTDLAELSKLRLVRLSEATTERRNKNHPLVKASCRRWIWKTVCKALCIQACFSRVQKEVSWWWLVPKDHKNQRTEVDFVFGSTHLGELPS